MPNEAAAQKGGYQIEGRGIAASPFALDLFGI
jgi:hypothetical protein